MQQELQARLEESDRLRRQHMERARYEAELAQRRYMRVDPENRLVADTERNAIDRHLRYTISSHPKPFGARKRLNRESLDSRVRAERSLT